MFDIQRLFIATCQWDSLLYSSPNKTEKVKKREKERKKIKGIYQVIKSLTENFKTMLVIGGHIWVSPLSHLSLTTILATYTQVWEQEMDQNHELALAQMRRAVHNLGSSTEVLFDLSHFYKVKVMNKEERKKMVSCLTQKGTILCRDMGMRLWPDSWLQDHLTLTRLQRCSCSGGIGGLRSCP